MQTYKYLNNKFYRMLLTVIFTASVFGCAGQKDFRRVAALAADSTNQLKLGTNNFFEEANQLDQNNKSRLRQLITDTEAIKRNTDVTIKAWEVSNNEKAAKMFAALSKKKSNEIVQSVKVTHATQNAERVNFSAIQYDNLIKRLNELAKEPGFSDTVSSFIAYGKAVNDKLKEDKEKAKDKLVATNETSKIADNNLKEINVENNKKKHEDKK